MLLICFSIVLFQVKVSDNGDIPKHSICKVSVRVVPGSVKSKIPPVVKTPQSVKLTEGDDIGFLVSTITAKTSDNGSLWYDIVGKYFNFQLSLLN